ncbi:hypothetical protein NL676_032109 [Syzygium grande]|nr:hypothetical protein NL676_032109 [Syzygium grande]
MAKSKATSSFDNVMWIKALKHERLDPCLLECPKVKLNMSNAINSSAYQSRHAKINKSPLEIDCLRNPLADTNAREVNVARERKSKIPIKGKDLVTAGGTAGGGGIRLDALCDACGPVSVLFGCLGIAFKFAELEFVSKVRDLMEASKKYGTLEKIIDFDVANCTVKKQGSHTRNLRRVRLGLDLIRALFEQFLSSHDNSLKEAATTAYSRVCAPYHSWAVRTAVYTGMYALPSRDQLLLKLNENDHSAEKKMRRYINACIPVIEYIDKLYLSTPARRVTGDTTRPSLRRRRSIAGNAAKSAGRKKSGHRRKPADARARVPSGGSR